MYLFVWALMLVQFRDVFAGYVEIFEISFCDSCRVLLTCRHLTSILAILEVDFLPFTFDYNDTYLENSTVTPTIFPPMSPRECINQRCSGVNHCSFIFAEDCYGSQILSRNLTVKYACVSEDKIKRYCNSDIVLPEEYTSGTSVGFLHNPGYPRFYPGHRECRWRITAHKPQRITLTILDISLIVDNVLSPSDCTDVLEIRDSDQVIHSTCRQEQPPAEVVSVTESVEVVLVAGQSFNPRRGVLIRYSVFGCPQLHPPQDAYVVFRNDDLTVFSCCMGYEFPDTRSRWKSIKCLGAYWNTSLPLVNCEKSISPHRYNRTRELERTDNTVQNMSTEIIAPIILIVAIFAINAAIMFFIHRAKKRQSFGDVKDEEVGALEFTPLET